MYLKEKVSFDIAVGETADIDSTISRFVDDAG